MLRYFFLPLFAELYTAIQKNKTRRRACMAASAPPGLAASGAGDDEPVHVGEPVRLSCTSEQNLAVTVPEIL
jgi:hypothetical protein